MPDAVTDQVTRALPGLIELRRDLHKNPELGFYETRTAGIIADRLNAAGMAVKAVFGELGTELLLWGQRAFPDKLVESGFTFFYEGVEQSLRFQLGRTE